MELTSEYVYSYPVIKDGVKYRESYLRKVYDGWKIQDIKIKYERHIQM